MNDFMIGASNSMRFEIWQAHPEEISISRQDAEDLQTFVYAIVEYIYDLTDRYEEFKARLAQRKETKC